MNFPNTFIAQKSEMLHWSDYERLLGACQSRRMSVCDRRLLEMKTALKFLNLNYTLSVKYSWFSLMDTVNSRV